MYCKCFRHTYHWGFSWKTWGEKRLTPVLVLGASASPVTVHFSDSVTSFPKFHDARWTKSLSSAHLQQGFWFQSVNFQVHRQHCSIITKHRGVPFLLNSRKPESVKLFSNRLLCNPNIPVEWSFCNRGNLGKHVYMCMRVCMLSLLSLPVTSVFFRRPPSPPPRT